MMRLVEWGIANSLTVAILTPFVFLLGRLSRQPAVRHALWILLLIKLVTPPLIPVDVRMEWPALAPAAAANPNSAPANTAILPSQSRTSSTAEDSTGSGPQIVTAVAAPRSAPVAFSAPAPRIPNSVAARPLPAMGALSGPSSSVSAEPGTPRGSLAGPWSSLLLFGPAIVRGALVLWAAGCVVFFVVQMARLALFARRLKRASYYSQALQNDKDHVAAGLGRKNSPAVLMVNGVVSPMLWGFGRWCRILFPAELYTQLSPEARRTLLLHELAHFHRADHWIRALELVTANLFWWHPVVWLALREIESSEEECCDNWVIRRTTSAPRCYAEAILDTIDFLCEKNPLAPPAVSGLGNPRELRGRLGRIMQGEKASTINLLGRGLVALVLIGLPLQPQAFATFGFSLREILDPAPTSDPPAPTRTKTASSIAAAPFEHPPTGSASRSAVTESAASRTVRSVPSDWAKAISDDQRFEIRARVGRRMELFDHETSTATPLTEWKIASVAFLPSRQQFVSGGFDRQIRLWDAATGQVIENFDEGGDAVVSVAASPEGDRIGTGSRSGEVALYRTDTLGRADSWKFTGAINSVRFSADGNRLAVSTGGWRSETAGTVYVIDLQTGHIDHEVSLERPAGVVAFTEDPEVLAAGGWDGSLSYVRLTDGALLARASLSKDLVSAGSFSEDTHVFPAMTLEAAKTETARLQWEAAAQAAATFSEQFLSPTALPVPASVPAPALAPTQPVSP